MFENSENLVPGEDGTENVERTTEEITEQEGMELETGKEPDNAQEEKVYTQKEFEEKLGRAIDKKMPRLEAKLRREYQKETELAELLKAGTGKENIEDVTGEFRKFYQDKGIQIPDSPKYSDRDIKVLAAAEAKEIIGSGYDEVTDELDRLTQLGVKNMTPREKEVYVQLADYHKSATQSRELQKIGVPQDVYESGEFKSFSEQFNQNVPVAKIYEMYSKMKPQKEIRQPGSIKGTTQENAVKDFYTHEEASKFTREELRKNPELFKAVEKSMLKW